MRMLFVILVLALLAIVFEVYSDVSLTSANVSHAVRDLAAAAIAHGVKREKADEVFRNPRSSRGERVTDPTILAARVSCRTTQSAQSTIVLYLAKPTRSEIACRAFGMHGILELEGPLSK
jgi:hypothetical protein